MSQEKRPKHTLTLSQRLKLYLTSFSLPLSFVYSLLFRLVLFLDCTIGVEFSFRLERGAARPIVEGAVSVVKEGP